MGGTRQGSQVDMITGGGERTELRARVERDSSERTGGERRHSRKRGGVAGGGVSEPGSTGLPSQEVLCSCFTGRLQVVPQSRATPGR